MKLSYTLGPRVPKGGDQSSALQLLAPRTLVHACCGEARTRKAFLSPPLSLRCVYFIGNHTRRRRALHIITRKYGLHKTTATTTRTHLHRDHFVYDGGEKQTPIDRWSGVAGRVVSERARKSARRWLDPRDDLILVCDSSLDDGWLILWLGGASLFRWLRWFLWPVDSSGQQFGTICEPRTVIFWPKEISKIVVLCPQEHGKVREGSTPV